MRLQRSDRVGPVTPGAVPAVPRIQPHTKILHGYGRKMRTVEGQGFHLRSPVPAHKYRKYIFRYPAPRRYPATRYSSALALTVIEHMDLAMEDFEFTQDEWKQINALEISFSIASINNDALVESDSEPMQLPKKKRRLVIASDSDSDTRQTKPGSRSHSWKPTNKTEIKQFLGLVLFMGVVKLPKLAYYWSKDKILGQTFPATVMSRNRFELLLQYLHFSDNLSVDRNDRIAKIRPLIDALNATFQKYYSPKEDVCVDESQVPFRGRIIFRQYNKSKRHKYVCPAQYSSTAPCRSRSTNKVTVSMAGGEKSSLNMTIR
ncbi:PiggyBac transposable element-derived protein 4 [Eumeta japonica]|uniref:PiggyBac transposable element-derived protein 4 n=1 Tax=Eumeta variegata TaxID=151549 RepID=A0A4C1SUC0_EUMVA|nr:PiggyBac transposable element-derived protein 4 [Eumeta japonica]